MKVLTLAGLAAATLSLSLGSMALAANEAHEMRSKVMKSMGAQVGVLGKMAKGEMPYDAAAAKAAAEELAKIAGQDFVPLFPEGSDFETTGEGRALKVIWENLDDVMAKHDALVAATAALVPVAGEGLDAMQAGLNTVGGACGSCHKVYRKPE